MSRSAWLWLAASVVTLASAEWQRRSGPSYPYRAELTSGAKRLTFELPRSHVTTSGARIAVPEPGSGPGTGGMLFWRRYEDGGAFSVTPLGRDDGELVAVLPAAPPAGRVEYYLDLRTAAGPLRIPARSGETVVLRYHGPVPVPILAAHIIVMFLAILVGVAAGLGALADPAAPAGPTYLTLGLLTLGGLLLGPVTQWYAFGAWWTGVPVGWDLTDNKTLLMWLGWAVAALAVRRRRPAARWMVAAAAALMLAVYLVPHSASGSHLERGGPPAASAP